MRLAKTFLALAAIAATAGAQIPRPAPVPRPAPEFAILLPEGGQLLLSKFRGKVVVLEFLFTTCPHCQEASRHIQKLYNDYGPKGMQPLGVAFNDMPQLHAPDFKKSLRLTYPVGYQSRGAVMHFLGRSPDEMIHVPQVVFIDKKGVIRQQSLPRGDGRTHSEANMRQMIETLLKEPGPSPKKTVKTKKSS